MGSLYVLVTLGFFSDGCQIASALFSTELAKNLLRYAPDAPEIVRNSVIVRAPSCLLLRS